MMFKVETSTLAEYFAADLGRDADLRAVQRPAGAVSGCTIRTGERGAL
jgi:hypothetical protein